MKPNRLALLVAVSGSLVSLAGCAQSDGGPVSTGTTAIAPASNVEQVLADVDTGRDLAGARTKLEALHADASLAKDQRARVAVALAQVLAPTDKDRATTLLEEASALGDQNAETRLFTLLAGHEPPRGARRMFPPPLADSARALSRYFPAAGPDTAVDIEILAIGGGDAHASDDLGTFDIGAALREQALEACGLCDDPKTKVHTHLAREGLWSAIPRYAATLPKALVVVYVAEDTIVPERYAQWLAVSNEEIRAAFARNEGLYAIKEREGAPPLVTIAAPRASRFAAVERAFAERRELPKQPVAVKVTKGLTPEEVQTGVRERFSAFRACYEKLLLRAPAASGRVDVDFAIRGDGKVEGAKLAFDGTLEDREMRACMEHAVASVSFPAWASAATEKITVKYPIVLHPN